MTETIEDDAAVEAEVTHLRAVIDAWEKRHRLVWTVLGWQARRSGLCPDFEEEAGEIEVPSPIRTAGIAYEFPKPLTREALSTTVEVRITARVLGTVNRAWLQEQMFGPQDPWTAFPLELSGDLGYQQDISFAVGIDSIGGRCPCISANATSLIMAHLGNRSDYHNRYGNYRLDQIVMRCDAPGHGE